METRPIPKCASITLFAVLCLAIVLGMDTLLQSPVSTGYSSLEYSGTAAVANNVTNSYTQKQLILVGFSGGFHVLFAVSYTMALSLGASWAARAVPYEGILKNLGHLAAWTMIIAFIFDIILQSSIISGVANGFREPIPHLMTACAAIHTIFIVTTALYIVVIFVVWVVKWRNSNTDA